METETKNTPTPLEASQDTANGNTYSIYGDGGNKHVAILDRQLDKDEAKATAERLALAYNNHDELVAMIALLGSELDRLFMALYDDKDPDTDGAGYHKAYKALIAKVKP